MKSNQLIDYIACARECTSSDITGFSRVQHIADGRAVAQYILRELGWTWQQIADLFDCHHASCIYNWKKVRRIDDLEIEAKGIIDKCTKISN